MKNGHKPSFVQLNGKALAAFQWLRQAFQEASILQHFDPEQPIIVETDTLEFAIKAILL